jgi:hypothetical protein
MPRDVGPFSSVNTLSVILHYNAIFTLHFRPSLRVLGRPVAQLVEALRHKPEGRVFDSPWCRWNFSLISSFRPQYGPGADSVSKRNEYQEYFLGVKAAGA